MKRKIKIPLPDADQYYDLLIQNEKTKGTYEQKMLVLRRRFDRILRDVTGPFSSSSSFYKDSMATIKGELGISDEKWAEFDKMKDSFNTLMHRDVSVGKGRYMLCLQRMAGFVCLLTKVEIPLELCGIFEKKNKIATKGKIPVFCCISSDSIIEKENRDLFNNAAFRFRNELLSDSRIKDRIKFTFLFLFKIINN